MFDPSRPFLTQDALAAGLSKRELTSDRYTRFTRGVHVLASAPTDALAQARAVLLASGPGAFVSHHSAARLYGLPVPDDPRLHASRAGDGHRSRRPEVVVHRSRRTPIHHRGVAVTAPVDTFLDLASCLSLVHLVVLGDAMVRRRLCTVDDLTRGVQEEPRGRRAASEAAGFVRAGVDSPMETRTRLLLVLAGLPEPATNIELCDDFGHVVRRIDMGYERALLGVEYDGRQHAESIKQWEGDVIRREDLTLLGWRLVTLTSREVLRRPDLGLERVQRALHQRGMRVPRLRDDWRRHFPVRNSPQ